MYAADVGPRFIQPRCGSEEYVHARESSTVGRHSVLCGGGCNLPRQGNVGKRSMQRGLRFRSGLSDSETFTVTDYLIYLIVLSCAQPH